MMKLKKLLLTLFALSHFASGAVAFNNANTITRTLGTSATLSFSVTAGGSNIVAYAVVMYDNAAAESITSVTWNGVSMGVVCGPTAASAQNAYAVIYGLANPATGTNSLVVTGNANVSETYVNLVSFTGVDSTLVRASSCKATTGTGSTAAQTITSQIGDITITGIDSGPIVIVSSSQTSDGFTSAGTYAGGSDHATGAATVTHTWTLNASSPGWAMAGFSIPAFSGAAAPTGFNKKQKREKVDPI